MKGSILLFSGKEVHYELRHKLDTLGYFLDFCFRGKIEVHYYVLVQDKSAAQGVLEGEGLPQELAVAYARYVLEKEE